MTKKQLVRLAPSIDACMRRCRANFDRQMDTFDFCELCPILAHCNNQERNDDNRREIEDSNAMQVKQPKRFGCHAAQQADPTECYLCKHPKEKCMRAELLKINRPEDCACYREIEEDWK